MLRIARELSESEVCSFSIFEDVCRDNDEEATRRHIEVQTEVRCFRRSLSRPLGALLAQKYAAFSATMGWEDFTLSETLLTVRHRISGIKRGCFPPHWDNVPEFSVRHSVAYMDGAYLHSSYLRGLAPLWPNICFRCGSIYGKEGTLGSGKRNTSTFLGSSTEFLVVCLFR